MPPTSAPALDRPLEPEHPPAPGRAADERVNRVTSIPFLLLHLLPLLAIFTGVSVKAVVLCVVLYYGRMFFITAGYHRYFSHRSYRLSRFWQFVMAFGGTTAAQKGPLWWAAHHRDHHRYSDSEQRHPLADPEGLLLEPRRLDPVRQVRGHRARPHPRLRQVPRAASSSTSGTGSARGRSASRAYLIAGWSGLLIGFFLSTVLLWHATFTVNSLAHVMGRRRYATEDTSRNSVLIALLTMGEGWHNNHHYYQASARQGFFWWEIDLSYYVLKVGSWVGIVHNLRTPPARVLRRNRVKQGAFDVGMFKAYWGKANRAVARSHAGPIGRAPSGPGRAQGAARGLRALLARVRRGAGPRHPHRPTRPRRRSLSLEPARSELGRADGAQRPSPAWPSERQPRARVRRHRSGWAQLVDRHRPVRPVRLGRPVAHLRPAAGRGAVLAEPRGRDHPHPLRRLRGDPAGHEVQLEQRPRRSADDPGRGRPAGVHGRAGGAADLPRSSRPHPHPQAGEQGLHATVGRAAAAPGAGGRRRDPRPGRRRGRSRRGDRPGLRAPGDRHLRAARACR